MKAYYFSRSDNTVKGNKIDVGTIHQVVFPFTTKENEVFDKPSLFKAGYEGGLRVIDALGYGQGPNLWIVELSGLIIEQYGMFVAERRKYLRFYDTTSILKEFAFTQTLLNMEKTKKYYDNEEDYNIVISWLTTKDEGIKEKAGKIAKNAHSKQTSELGHFGFCGSYNAYGSTYATSDVLASAVAWGDGSCDKTRKIPNAMLEKMLEEKLKIKFGSD